MNLYEILWNIGNKMCHQMPSRSLFIGGYQVPVCSRCSAIYIAFIATLIVAYHYRNEIFDAFENENAVLAIRNRLLVVSLVIPVAVDGLTQGYGWRMSNNLLRILTGGLFGIAASIAFVFSAIFVYKKSVSEVRKWVSFHR